MKRVLVHLLVAVSILAAGLSEFRVAAAPVLPGLSVSGAQIVANGLPVRLRGMNMGDPFWARNTGWYHILTMKDYASLARSWHANVVRIFIFPTQWKHKTHAQVLKSLGRQVNAALSHGMYVIISYQVIGWPDGYYQKRDGGNPKDQYDSSFALATSFWDRVSLKYGSDTRIIFDLWNEPVNAADRTVPPSTPNPVWPSLKVYYDSLIQTVRNNGAQNILLVTGNYHAGWLVGIKDDPIADPNVAYAFHRFSVPDRNTPAVWDEATGGLIGVKPVIVSAWGYEDKDIRHPTWPGTSADFCTPFTQWMESNQLSNLAYIYHYSWKPALLKSNGRPTLFGKCVKSYISAANTAGTLAIP